MLVWGRNEESGEELQCVCTRERGKGSKNTPHKRSATTAPDRTSGENPTHSSQASIRNRATRRTARTCQPAQHAPHRTLIVLEGSKKKSGRVWRHSKKRRRVASRGGGGLLAGDGELERNLLGAQHLVHRGERVELGLNVHLLLGVKVDLEELAAVGADAGALANNLGGVHEVLEDGLMNVLESAGTRANAVELLVAGVRLLQHRALGDDDDVVAAELLLEFLNEDLLDLAEALEEVEGNEDDDRLLATLDLNLAGRGDVKTTELRLEGSVVQLKVEDLLGDAGLELGGLLALGLDNLLASSEHGDRLR
mmetsp:Transcript_30056/g.55867  ORF Transcript_30056/g.55867 Transcript_30056/m.55867 type:complete len:309 (+) Transcript_30056:79-1005(+)